MPILRFLLSFVLLLTFSTIVEAKIPRVTRAQLEARGYKLDPTPMKFNGTIGGHEVNYNGTIQEILAHLEASKPGFDRKSLLADINKERAARAVGSILEKRDGPVYCCPVVGQRFYPCDSDFTIGMINYLYGFLGDCHAPAGPGGCQRVACEAYSSIWLCNDYTVPIPVWCPVVGIISEDLHNICSYEGEVCGQIFSDDRNWNVFITGDDCWDGQTST